MNAQNLDKNLYNSPDVANKIKLLAKSKNISLKQMLEECGIGSNAMSHLLHGKTMAFDSLARIADYLDCSIDYLVGRSDDDTPMSFHSEWEDTFRERFAEEYANCDSADLEAAYIDRAFCEQIIDGTAPLRFHTACDLADELGVSLDYLLGRTDKPEVNK